MPEQGTQGNAANEPQTKAEGNRRKSFRPGWFTDVVGAWVAAAFSTVFAICGGALLNSHYQPFFLGWILILLAVFTFGGTAFFWLSNHRKKFTVNTMPSWLSMIVCLCIMGVGVISFAIALWYEKSQLFQVEQFAGRIVEWNPPELPKDTKTIQVRWGAWDNQTENPNKFIKQIPVEDIKAASAQGGYEAFSELEGTGSAGAYHPWMWLMYRNNRVYVNVSVQTGNAPIRIEDDRIGPLPSGYQTNHNSNCFEIVDAIESPVYQICYNGRDVLIMGCLDYHRSVIASSSGTHIHTNLTFDCGSLLLERLFLYPSKDHPGELSPRRTFK